LKLYFSIASPYSRKVRVIARELDLKLEEIQTSARGNMEFRRINPLGKVPALVLDDGSALFDSPVICEYLNHVGGGKFFPGMSLWRHTSGRWKALGLQALGDGLMDAAVERVHEDRLRPAELHSADIIANLESQIRSVLDALERVSFAADPTIGEISVGCALGFIDLRLGDLDWRATRPKLAAWYAKFSQYPSMLATAPK
jgi:glutathione S-transferase